MRLLWIGAILALAAPGALAQVQLQLPPAGRDLAAVVRGHPSGQVLTLGAETYLVTRPLTVDRSLHLRGVDRDATSVVFFGDAAVLVLTGDIDVTLEGITFERSGPPDRDLVVARGDVRLRVARCRFDGGLPFLVEGPAPRGHGILLVLEGGTAELVDNEIGRNAFGVGIGLTSRVALWGNTIVENAEAGVRLFGAAEGVASGNLVAMNGWGIAVVERAIVAMQGNAINGNFRGGLWFDDDARGEVIGHDIVSQAVGMVIGGRASPTVQRNYVGGLGSGIVIRGSARPTILENQIAGNSGFGIQVVGDAAPTLVGNTLTANGNEGIWFDERAGGVARDNVIEGHANVGILVQKDAHPLLEANVLRGNLDGAIEYYQRAAGVARGNVCEDEAAIETWGQSAPELEGNLCAHLEMREP